MDFNSLNPKATCIIIMKIIGKALIFTVRFAQTLIETELVLVGSARAASHRSNLNRAEGADGLWASLPTYQIWPCYPSVSDQSLATHTYTADLLLMLTKANWHERKKLIFYLPRANNLMLKAAYQHGTSRQSIVNNDWHKLLK